MHVMGDVFKPMACWDRTQIRHHKWIASVAGYYRAIDFDIGLAPLQPHVFSRSKSNLRLIEMAALGTPVLASDFGPYADPSFPGERGFLVKTDHEWGTYLHSLASDPDMRDRMGRNARQWAAGHTVEGNLDSWLAAWQVDALVGA